MATFIKVEQDGSELLRRNQEQAQAARLAKLEGDEQARTEKEAKRQRQAELQRQGLDASGNSLGDSRRRQPFRRDEPAATLLSLKDFAFVDANETYLIYSGIGVDPIYSGSTLIPATTGNLRNYKVIRVMIQGKNARCVRDEPTLTLPFFFGNRTAQFSQYVRAGGVLWINTEWSGCGFPNPAYDAFLADEFGATMRTGSGTLGQSDEFIATPFDNFVQRHLLAFAPLQAKAPPIFYTEVSDFVVGGTPLYVNPNGFAPVAFERIGNGYLVLSGDSNGTTAFPSYPDPARTFLDALLELRRLRP